MSVYFLEEYILLSVFACGYHIWMGTAGLVVHTRSGLAHNYVREAGV